MDPKKSYLLPEFLRVDTEGKPLSDAELNETGVIFDLGGKYTYPVQDTEKAWKRFSASLESPLTVSKRPVRFAMFRWVAAAVVVLTLGLGLWQYSANKAATYTALIETNTIIKGKQLPDGSIVSLNSGTVLNVKAISKNKRLLELTKGEAFFKVAHSDVPFRVITGKGIVTVLGTEFNIRCSNGLPFSIYLKSGSVQFESGGEKTLLKSGDLLEEDKNGDFVIRQISNNNPIAWSSGKISFDNAVLSDVIKGLEELYKVEFEYDQNLASEKLTISFENLTAVQAAELLSKTLKSKVSVK